MKVKSAKNTVSFFVILFVLSILLNCQNHNASKTLVGRANPDKQNDLKEILKDNRLVILVENSTTSYFIYKGQKMGFEYEILNEFAKSLGVKLEVNIINDLNNVINELNEGYGDILACNFTVTKDRKKEIDFSEPILRAPQVLVQRLPEGWEHMKKNEIEKHLIRDPIQLSRKTIHVWNKSSYYDRLINLQHEMGDTFIIAPLDGNLIAEEAVEMVSKGIIDYTVVDKNVAIINQRYNKNVDTKMLLSFEQQIAFAVRKESPLLRKKLNSWLKEFKQTTKFKYIKHKYYDLSEYTDKSQSEYSSIKGGKISGFDNIIKNASKKRGWDWRLVASIIYQESKFTLENESWAGAYGLMQFMPSVGPIYGVYPDSPPEVQIEGGLKKLSYNYKQWASIKDSIQRIKFTIATYNAGMGHVLDAQKLAEKYGKDPHKWDDNVEIYMRYLSDPKYYKDPLVKFGYIRGNETFNYTRAVYARYLEYKKLFKEYV
ncbi:MAG: transporter substrate-binding domain-containing protein [Brumimicrobium sp.]|nr:transporter substrate-binding domain-containing protein [Brumimicrobium sp.]